MRRGLRALSTVLIVAGALLLADAAVTLAWKEPVSALIARLTQSRLADDLRALELAPLSERDRRALDGLADDRGRLAFLARALRRTTERGEAIGRIRIPAIGVGYVMVEGTDGASLRKGPGHYPQTPLPGLRGTVAVAGHRTTYEAPFRRVDDLERGDEIVLEMPYGTFRYEVERTQIVAPDAWEVTRRVDHDRLVLTACHPLYSAAQRIVVFARQVEARGRGAGFVGGGRLVPPLRARGRLEL